MMDVTWLRFIVKALLRPFGLTITEQYIGYSFFINGILTRTKHQIGWRCAR